jgi:hypothetical protein
MKRCAARRSDNTMMCGKCGLQWDFNDPEKPDCNPTPPPALKPKKDKGISAEQWAELRRIINA